MRARSALREVMTTGEFEPGVGDLHVSAETGGRAGQVLRSIRLQWPTPDVTRVSGGGVVLRWSVADQDVEIAVLPRERLLLTILQAGEILESESLPSTAFPRVNDVLNTLMGTA